VIVWAHRILGGEMFEEDREHLETAYQAATRPEVRDSPYIRRVLDKVDGWNIYLISEYAERTLLDAIQNERGPVERRAVVENVGAAVAVFHSLGLVHCDVHPANVLQVDGVWKLADLGSVTKHGEHITSRPPERYRDFFPTDVDFGSPAEYRIDNYGLERLDAILAGE